MCCCDENLEIQKDGRIFIRDPQGCVISYIMRIVLECLLFLHVHKRQIEHVPWDTAPSRSTKSFRHIGQSNLWARGSIHITEMFVEFIGHNG